jgi:hypothetical protein
VLAISLARFSIIFEFRLGLGLAGVISILFFGCQDWVESYLGRILIVAEAQHLGTNSRKHAVWRLVILLLSGTFGACGGHKKSLTPMGVRLFVDLKFRSSSGWRIVFRGRVRWGGV